MSAIIIIKNSSTPGANMHLACGRSHRGRRKAALVAGSKGRVSVSALALALALAPAPAPRPLSWHLLCGHLHRRPCWDWCWCVVLPFVGLVFAPVSVVLAFALVSAVLAFVLVPVILAFVPVSVVLAFAPVSVILAFVPVSVVLAFVLVPILLVFVVGSIVLAFALVSAAPAFALVSIVLAFVLASVVCCCLSCCHSYGRHRAQAFVVLACSCTTVRRAAVRPAAVHCAWRLSCCCRTGVRRPSCCSAGAGVRGGICTGASFGFAVRGWRSCWCGRAVYLLRIGTHVPIIITTAKNRLSSLFSVHGTHPSCTWHMSRYCS
jgi:hypothetical protein